MELVAATPDDCALVIALWEACGLTRPWNDARSDFDRALTGPSSAILVARREDGIAGSIMVGHDGHRGWIYYLAVDPAHRQKGIGRWLMGAAETWLRDHEIPKLQLMVRDANGDAEAFYTALGYGRQPVSTWGKWLDEGKTF